MADRATNKTKPTQDNNSKPEIQKKSGYVNWWLFRNKGTVAEPWPTADQLWKDEDVQNEIQKVTEAFNHTTEKKSS